MLMRYSAAILGIVMLELVASPATGQHVETLKNGQAEVSYNNGCVVYYAKNGRRAHSRPGCSKSQERQADEAMAAYGRKQGLGNSLQNSHDKGCPAEPPVGLGEHAWNRCGN